MYLSFCPRSRRKRSDSHFLLWAWSHLLYSLFHFGLGQLVYLSGCGPGDSDLSRTKYWPFSLSYSRWGMGLTNLWKESQLSSGYRLAPHSNSTACLNIIGCLQCGGGGGSASPRQTWASIVFSQEHIFRVEILSSSLTQIMCAQITSCHKELT